MSVQANHDVQLESILSGTSGPPGKLYTSLAATALLETLETGGPCARLVPGDTATVEQRRVFDALSAKLGEGGLVRRFSCKQHIESSIDILISLL